MNKSFDLPSGAKLDVTTAPFGAAKALNKAFLKELKDVDLNGQKDVFAISKEIICAALISDEIEAALQECFKRVTYNSKRVDGDTWNGDEERRDYITACMHVAMVNLEPFIESLYALFGLVISKVQSTRS